MQALSDFMTHHAERIVEDGDCLRWTGACAGKTRHPAINTLKPRRKTVLVRRLVWEAEKGAIPPGKIIRCNCGTPQCIAIGHLELTTFGKLAKQLGALGIMSGPVRSANIAAAHRARHPKTKLTQEQVREIRASDEPGTVLAERYGVTESSISKYRLGHCRREYSGNVWQGLAC
jgi:hypothetical protein